MDSRSSNHSVFSNTLSRGIATASLASDNTRASVCEPVAKRTTAFVLDRWLVQPESNELRCLTTNERRTLEPRLMHLLCLLAAAPCRVFTRDELMAQVWPRVIVNENSLTRAISELRRRLSGGDASSRLVDTIPKIGYRLSETCSVRDFQALREENPERSIATLPPESQPRRPELRRSLVRSSLPAIPSLAVAAVLLLAVALGVVQSESTWSTGSATVALADITLSNQAAFEAMVGGKVETVAALDNANGTALLSGSQAQAAENWVTQLPGSSQPVISRDGRLFAFVHYDDQGSSLVLGSLQSPLSPMTVFTTTDLIFNLQWSPVDQALLFAQAPKLSPAALLPLDEQASLVMFDLESFATTVLRGPGGDRGHTVSPEGSSQPFKLT